MMKQLNTFEVIQNEAISAFAFHKFTYSYNVTAKSFNDKIDPSIFHFFPILPLLYHGESLDQICKSNELYMVIMKYPQICSSLQFRMHKMSSQTFAGLNLAFNKGLLTYDKNTHQISSLKSPVLRNYSADIQRIFKGANKLGRWCAKIPIEELQIMLKVQL